MTAPIGHRVQVVIKRAGLRRLNVPGPKAATSRTVAGFPDLHEHPRIIGILLRAATPPGLPSVSPSEARQTSVSKFPGSPVNTEYYRTNVRLSKPIRWADIIDQQTPLAYRRSARRRPLPQNSPLAPPAHGSVHLAAVVAGSHALTLVAMRLALHQSQRHLGQPAIVEVELERHKRQPLLGHLGA